MQLNDTLCVFVLPSCKQSLMLISLLSKLFHITARLRGAYPLCHRTELTPGSPLSVTSLLSSWLWGRTDGIQELRCSPAALSRVMGCDALLTLCGLCRVWGWRWTRAACSCSPVTNGCSEKGNGLHEERALLRTSSRRSSEQPQHTGSDAEQEELTEAPWARLAT